MENTLYQSGVILDELGEQINRACQEYADEIENAPSLANNAKIDIQLFADGIFLPKINLQLFADSVVPYGYNFANASGNALTTVGEKLRDVAIWVRDHAVEFGSNLGEKIRNAAIVVKERGKEFIDFSKEKLGKAADWVKNATAVPRQKLAEGLRNFGGKVKDVFHDVGGKLKETAVNCAQGIKNCSQKAKEKFKEMGAEVKIKVAGAVTGIALGAKALKDKLNANNQRNKDNDNKLIVANKKDYQVYDEEEWNQKGELIEVKAPRQKSRPGTGTLRGFLKGAKENEAIVDDDDVLEGVQEQIEQRERTNEAVVTKENEEAKAIELEELANIIANSGILNPQEAREVAEYLHQQNLEGKSAINIIMNLNNVGNTVINNTNSNNTTTTNETGFTLDQLLKIIQVLYPKLNSAETQATAEGTVDVVKDVSAIHVEEKPQNIVTDSFPMLLKITPEQEAFRQKYGHYQFNQAQSDSATDRANQ